jgi:hypothetical protein
MLFWFTVEVLGKSWHEVEPRILRSYEILAPQEEAAFREAALEFHRETGKKVVKCWSVGPAQAIFAN